MRIKLTVLLAVLLLILSSAGPAAAAGSDEAQEATKFRDLPFSDTTDASAYSGNASDPNVCGSGLSTNSVWYRFQPKTEGQVTIDTSGSNYDTVLAVFTSSPGQSAQELTLVACDDDGLEFAGDSIVSFYGERNATYFIMVDPWSSTGAGTLVLNAS